MYWIIPTFVALAIICLASSDEWRRLRRRHRHRRRTERDEREARDRLYPSRNEWERF